MSVCPHCGGTGHLPDTDPVDALRRWCVERNIWVGPAGDVSEATAAVMLGRQPATLRSWRNVDGKLPYRKVAGRIRYRIDDIAKLIESEVKF